MEWVGHESEWRDTGAFYAETELRWLKPGWGALYRIIPIPAGISSHGTAYNNGVRAENPSTDATERDRFMVYERDSVVYLRTIDLPSGDRLVAERRLGTGGLGAARS